MFGPTHRNPSGSECLLLKDNFKQSIAHGAPNVKRVAHLNSNRRGREGFGELLRIVEDILDQWYGPNDIFFKVRADDGTEYVVLEFTFVSESLSLDDVDRDSVKTVEYRLVDGEPVVRLDDPDQYVIVSSGVRLRR